MTNLVKIVNLGYISAIKLMYRNSNSRATRIPKHSFVVIIPVLRLPGPTN